RPSSRAPAFATAAKAGPSPKAANSRTGAVNRLPLDMETPQVNRVGRYCIGTDRCAINKLRKLNAWGPFASSRAAHARRSLARHGACGDLGGFLLAVM